MRPLVTAVVTTYNQAPYIEAALESVLGQTYGPLEVLVIDDGSTDDTPGRVARFRDRVTYVRQPNRGVAASRNAGLSRATGTFVAPLDGDDLWEPEKVEAQVDAARAHPRSGLVVVDGVQFSEEGILGATLFSHTARALLATGDGPVLTGNAYRDLVTGNFICTTSQIMIPAPVLRDVGLSDERFSVASDYDLYLRIAAKYEVTIVRKPLARWRYVSTSASGPRELRVLRWREDEIEILKKHLREAAPAHRPHVRRALRTRISRAAREAYEYGRAADRAWAARYLLRLQARNAGEPAVLPFLIGLWTPGPLRRLLRPLLHRSLGIPSETPTASP